MGFELLDKESFPPVLPPLMANPADDDLWVDVAGKGEAETDLGIQHVLFL